MIDIRKHFIAVISILLLFGCIEPNVEDLWSVTEVEVLNTTGFSRDVAIHENTAFIAAGQSGIQIWNLKDKIKLSDFSGYYELGSFLEFDDLSLIEIDITNSLIFSSETNKDVQIFNYTVGDSNLSFINTIMSARTREFVSFPIDTGRFVMYAADNDDGLKWSIYEPYEVFGYSFWNPVYPEGSAGELYTPGKPQGIDSNGENYIALAVDQLGVELYELASLEADPEFIGRVDTEGNAEKVVLADAGVFVSCDDVGAAYIPYNVFSTSSNSHVRFAQDLTVDHISVSDGIAALSLGSKGIALYDITNPNKPIEKGLFPIGYVYKTEFWGENLIVCSREGLQILSINQ